MNKWIARFGFSFLVLGGLCAWEGYKRMSQIPHNKWQIYAFFLGAGILFGLGVKGMRERHCRDEPDEQ